ncbi:tRNA 2'-phosphotransferase [Paracoccidioides brasiliensis Pb18]|uniref:2'-phosphotransferase n=2 Tax=Paracoccidioides brasiliensis TaxID=121759 RepID=A0A0A0HV01_PARBD|nr:tRNA 2'-phosphotransferase [Paracoccidioides brasiliensis Pb18]KGM92442.1 hypothetical protein PADG_11258 [Paracoccidioides brasiliensis Pb18]ODH30766.1 hypothetical protein ACO22_03542 [Paracoccidioides brasiliensis]ODH52291.1 hypothetical protein GX48_01609 [Paracoccidioides brasiliensis]
MSHSGRGQDRGRGSGRSGPSREVTVSKALSYILRHAAEKEGVKIDSHGYANVADVLAWRKLKSLKVTLPEILSAVSTSDKQRFGLLYEPLSNSPSATATPTDCSASTASRTATAQALTANDPEPSHYLIRATQGHSIKTVEASSLLQRLSLTDGTDAAPSTPPLPDTVVHGTYHGAWPSILVSGGLKCMNRNHVHFATGPPLSSVLPEGREGHVVTMAPGRGGVISGMRADAQILIYIDLKKALEAGVPFWRSENGVILSEGLDMDGDGRKIVGLEFFDLVVERRNGLGVLWDRERGGLMKETPDWMMTAKTPKGGAGGGERGRGGKGGKSGEGSEKGRDRAPRLRVEAETDVEGADDI